jgi:hypothetical protein
MPTTAATGRPHTVVGASVRGLTARWLGTATNSFRFYTVNYACDCRRKVELDTGSRSSPKTQLSGYARHSVMRFLIWNAAAKAPFRLTSFNTELPPS